MLDLCDALSSFSSQGKVGLDELSRVMGLPGKLAGITGTDVERYYKERRLAEIAEYCQEDVVNTYRVWLRYELFCGRLSDAGFQASEAKVVEFVSARKAKPAVAEVTE